MPTHRYSDSEPVTYLATRVAIETLRLTGELAPISLQQISEKAGTTLKMTEIILHEIMEIDNPSGVRMTHSLRFKLALKAARLGALPEVAGALTWQEFETFGSECLSYAGFQPQKGLVFKDGGRRWQIDIVARRDPMIFAIDCKHWRSPNYSSKFKKAAEHQRLALDALLHHRERGRNLNGSRVWALPLILTLFEPRQRIIDEVVLVSVGQLPDFLEHVTPYDEDLPFVRLRNHVESSIS